MTTHRDLGRRAQQQRERRMARRRCGNCGEQADAMMVWGTQYVSVCFGCRGRLTGDMPDWSRYGPGQGPRCPVGTVRPCYDCTREDEPAGEEPTVEAGRRETARPPFSSLFGPRH